MVFSDRRYKQMLEVMAGESWYEGETQVTPDSLMVGVHILWDKPEQKRRAEQVIRACVNPIKVKVQEMLSAAVDAVGRLDEFATPQEIIQVMKHQGFRRHR